jgi:hypothetical protein
MAINSATINTLTDAIRTRVGTIEGTSRLHGVKLMPTDPTLAIQKRASFEAILFVKVLTNLDKISFITDTINMLEANNFDIERVQFENVPDGAAGTYRFSALINDRTA